MADPETIVSLPTSTTSLNPNSQVSVHAQEISLKEIRQEPRNEPKDCKNKSESKEEKRNLSFQYLELQSGEIRIVDIHAANSHDGPIVCTLRCVSLASKPAYDALSYTWGNQEHETNILVNGQKFSIRENAGAALRRLRQSTGPRPIWIDAICINQNNEIEKSFQLPLMTEIYEQARQVCIWLGEETEGSVIAMEKLAKKNMSYKMSFRQLKIDRKYGKLSVPLRHRLFSGSALMEAANRAWEFYHGEIRELLSRPWWSRVWIMQEVIVAPKALIMCGADTLDWDDISHWQYFSMQTTKSGEEIKSPFGLDIPPELDILDSFYHTITNFRQEWKENKWNTSIYDLLFQFRHLGCANNRDRIYGFLGLAGLSSDSKFKPSYQNSIQEVYRNFSEAIIRQTGYLDILNYKREWKDVPRIEKEVLAYSLIDQAKYHDVLTSVVDAEGKRPRKAWARLPDGWERRKRGKNFYYYDWNTRNSSETSPLKGRPPPLVQHVGEQKLCPPGWQRIWDNLGKVSIQYVPNSPTQDIKNTAKGFELPSWVPDWSSMTQRDPSAFLGGDGSRFFCAGNAEKIQLSDYVHLDKLSLEGFNFDQIAQLAAPWHPSHPDPPMSRKGIPILQQWEAMALADVAHCPYGSHPARESAVWRTHIADYPGEAAAPESDRRLLECWYDRIGWSQSRPSYRDLAGKPLVRASITQAQYQTGSEMAMKNHYLDLRTEEWMR